MSLYDKTKRRKTGTFSFSPTQLLLTSQVDVRRKAECPRASSPSRQFGILIQRDAAEFAVVFCEMNGGHDDVVVRDAVGAEAGDQIVDLAKDAFNGGGPFAVADADALRNLDALTGLQACERLLNGGIEFAGRQQDFLGAHD